MFIKIISIISIKIQLIMENSSNSGYPSRRQNYGTNRVSIDSEIRGGRIMAIPAPLHCPCFLKYYKVLEQDHDVST